MYVALHANHPRELTDAARAACRRLIDAGIAMVSQSVLLKGVNDDADTLEALMRGFVEMRVKPYYLHHGDLAPGTAHLRTTIAEGQALMRALRARLSGLALPTYVLDIPGAHGKVPVGVRIRACERRRRLRRSRPRRRGARLRGCVRRAEPRSLRGLTRLAHLPDLGQTAAPAAMKPAEASGARQPTGRNTQ